MSHVVEKSLLSDLDSLKERQIGISVFDRPEDWDPKLDNIVRSEARRLRAKLEAYAAANDPEERVRITIPKGSYIATFDVRNIPEPAIGRGPHDSPVLPQRTYIGRFRDARLWALGLALAVTFTACVGVLAAAHDYAVSANDRHRYGATWSIAPFAVDSGRQFSPDISPDGRLIAYVAVDADNGSSNSSDIIVRPATGGSATDLIHNGHYNLHPAWSPSGDRLAYLQKLDTESRLIISGRDGRSQRQVSSIHDATSEWTSSGPLADCQKLSWSRDGRSIYLTSQVADLPDYGIVSVSTADGRQHAVTMPPGVDQDCYARISPDGRTLAFARFISHGVSDIYVVSPEGGTPKRLTYVNSEIRGLDWSADGESIIYAVRDLNRSELRVLNVSTGSFGVLPLNSAWASDPVFSPASQSLAFVEQEDRWTIWRARLDHGHIEDAKPFLTTSGQNHSPSVSPDGKTVAFVSDRSGAPEIWFASPDGSQLRQMTHFGGPWLGTIRWSPDSSRIIFDARPGGHATIFMMAAEDSAPAPILQGDFECRRPSWSRRGDYIYYDSTSHGRSQLWTRSLPDAQSTVIGPSGSQDAQESKDGKDVFFLVQNPGSSSSLWKSSTAPGSKASPLSISPTPVLDWTVANDTLLYTQQHRDSFNLVSYDPRSRRSVVLGVMPQDLSPGTPSLAASPDGKWIFYAVVTHVRSDISLATAPR
ncbi:PD40 domain-containing protein [Paracidobacterium acidisoli]|uniref:PD40 domain-containing protein n=1 Tax=Paracidobacterium acidisoli TaxID=2303751 RepID=UPI001314B6E2|nr:PD40 domain-containing protein [Paracidobacterium acidisoli]MBT9333128.1 hypothetical protein [Paracidobacterium acidisoli]